MKTCKYCGKNVPGVEPHHMATHVRHHCPARKAVRSGKSIVVISDPIMIIESSDADKIEQEIGNLDRRRQALLALLTVAKAKGVEVQTT